MSPSRRRRQTRSKGVGDTRRSAPRSVAALTDAVGMGGIVSQDGFDYQTWQGLLRVPAWLRSEAFESVVFEGLEDFEARFFAPHAQAGHVLDRYQAKSGVMTRSDIIAVLERFASLATLSPRAARASCLVTPSVPSSLSWIGRDPDRVRRLRPFYDPFPQIVTASDHQLHRDFEQEFGDTLGTFVASSVDVQVSPVLDRNTAAAMFATEVGRHFPHVQASLAAFSTAFAALVDVVGRNRGSVISRQVLVDTIERAIGESLRLPSELPCHIRSDRASPEAHAIEIDASRFSDMGVVPAPEDWHAGVVAPLLATARWAATSNRSRIRISGQFRLSTALALGWSFRSATGFELEIPTREGNWATDSHPQHTDPCIPLRVIEPQRSPGDQLLVAFSVVREIPLGSVLSIVDVQQDQVLGIHVPAAVVSATDAQWLAREIKSVIARVSAHWKVSSIGLCYLGPAAFAVAMGHRWNALPVTQVYEWSTVSARYYPSVRLG